MAVADPAFVGRDAGEVAELGPCGVTVVASAAEAFAAGAADVALVLTGSGVAEVDARSSRRPRPRGVDVISTCEDLAYADLSTPELARQIDARARAAGITVVGTGVNPGFVMDRLPLTLAAACVRVDRVQVDRVVDAAKRRVPLRAKVGAGLTVDEFRAGVAARQLGHRGLRRVVRARRPGARLAPRRDPDDDRPGGRRSRAGIPAGRVAGLRQSAVGVRGGREIVRLDLEMSIARARSPRSHRDRRRSAARRRSSAAVRTAIAARSARCSRRSRP